MTHSRTRDLAGVARQADVLIAADDATFAFPPARDLGALPNNMWLYNVGPQWAKRLILTGDTVTGAEAAEIGLVLKSLPADVLDDEVEQLADRLSMIDPDLLVKYELTLDDLAEALRLTFFALLVALGRRGGVYGEVDNVERTDLSPFDQVG